MLKKTERILPESGKRLELERPNYCACGIMSKCTAGEDWKSHYLCRYARKSAVGDRCMYYRIDLEGHCDCASAQMENCIDRCRLDVKE